MAATATVTRVVYISDAEITLSRLSYAQVLHAYGVNCCKPSVRIDRPALFAWPFIQPPPHRWERLHG